MTSNEIRNHPITTEDSGLDDPQCLAVGFAGLLQELAAQVAELNEQWIQRRSEICRKD